uniref:Uncharacterized protein n=1 Tax=Rhizophora mucronata TaxID=61149 RepID=A0A2P2QDX1_RHIMU
MFVVKLQWRSGESNRTENVSASTPSGQIFLKHIDSTLNEKHERQFLDFLFAVFNVSCNALT